LNSVSATKKHLRSHRQLSKALKIAKLLLLIYSFKFMSAFLYLSSLVHATTQSAISADAELLGSSCDYELWPVILTFRTWPRKVKWTFTPNI